MCLSAAIALPPAVKCIITVDAVLVFDYNHPAVRTFMPDLQRALNQPPVETPGGAVAQGVGSGGLSGYVDASASQDLPR